MHTHPYFSIITPVYNGEAFISRCLQSVVNQTLQDFEHIILDGNSTDKTFEIVTDFGKGYPQLVYRREADAGVYDAMNRGIRMARGTWLYFLGCDDYLMDHNVLSKCKAMMELATESLVHYGNVWNERSGGLYDGMFSAEKILRRNICHQSIFYHRTIFEKVGMYDLRYKIEADYVLNLTIMLRDDIPMNYLDLTISFFSSGGLSAQKSDPLLKEKYGRLVFGLIWKGSFSLLRKLRLSMIAMFNIRFRTFITSPS